MDTAAQARPLVRSAKNLEHNLLRCKTVSTTICNKRTRQSAYGTRRRCNAKTSKKATTVPRQLFPLRS